MSAIPEQIARALTEAFRPPVSSIPPELNIALDNSRLKNLDHDMDIVDLRPSKFDDAPSKPFHQVKYTNPKQDSESQSDSSNSYFTNNFTRPTRPINLPPVTITTNLDLFPTGQPKATQPTNPTSDPGTPPNQGGGDTGDPSTKETNTQTLPQPTDPEYNNKHDLEVVPEFQCWSNYINQGRLCQNDAKIQPRKSSQESSKIHPQHNSTLRRKSKIPKKRLDHNNVSKQRRSSNSNHISGRRWTKRHAYSRIWESIGIP